MKYGEHLKANIATEYGPDPYLDYQQLDRIISELSQIKPGRVDETSRVLSMTAPPHIDEQGHQIIPCPTVTEETFLRVIDANMVKVEQFTLTRVTRLRSKLCESEALLKTKGPGSVGDELARQADEIANDFLSLEKYVNINFMGFHKILKKHDKNLPDFACKRFYVNRLHAQAWVRGDYSDIVVRLSEIYSALRNDNVAEDNKDASQSFLRNTSKYWVKTEDVSRVKYRILKHLPVFLQKTSTGESDAQFTNSVYLDNIHLELYHGRLDKSPGAINLRLRWYGPGDPKIVFVERKTHHDKWTGLVSVKERFVIEESEVQQVLNNTYPIAKKKQEMLDAGKTQKEADEWETLVREITQVIACKQLVPAVRTQCMRTAFQIPFDATVRISLDTNLCMISERGYNLQNMKVWHRDKSWVLEKNQIHRFPHAILEIKLEMGRGDMTPPKWVTDLQNSGMLYECHKFSKYIHGCMVLLPEDIRAAPYWVDDVTLRQSIIDSGAERILVEEDKGTGPGATSIYDQLLPFGSTVDNRTDSTVGRTASDMAASRGLTGEKAALLVDSNFGIWFHSGEEDLEEEEEEEEIMCGWLFPFCSNRNMTYELLAPTRFQKIEPKVFFANERTFIHWLHYGVLLSSIASGILAFSSETGQTWATWYALTLLLLSLPCCIYALHVYLSRLDRIKARIPSRWDDPKGPIVLGSVFALVLACNLVIKVCVILRNRPQP